MHLRLIHQDSIASVLDKARQYRSLLEPELAISICLDIFAIDANHQQALVIYILASTDLYSHPGMKVEKQKITQAIAQLESEFERVYYSGILLERQARSLLKNAMSRSFAYDLFMQAIALYDQSESLSPKGNDDAILRYNACVRTIHSQRLSPRQDVDDGTWQSES